jgi:hypothetical protein
MDMAWSGHNHLFHISFKFPILNHYILSKIDKTKWYSLTGHGFTLQHMIFLLQSLLGRCEWTWPGQGICFIFLLRFLY